MNLRHLIDLVESKSRTRTLYRGDAAKIEEFSTEHTRNSFGLLFGLGIYLTDNPRIALDYTVKGAWKPDGAGTVLLRTEAKSHQDAVREYLLHLIYKRLGWARRREEIKDDFLHQHNANRIPQPESPRWFQDGSPNPEHEEWATKNRAAQAATQKQFETMIKNEFGVFLKKAKMIYRKEKDQLRVLEDTMGQWVIMRDTHEGTITTFEIPDDYIARVIHGDQPLDDKSLEMVRAFVNEITEGQVSDFRNFDGDKWYSFDDWLEIYRTQGSRYAWREEHIGGKGQNPSLDHIWNGTHGGLSIFNRDIDKFIEMAKSAGIVGIEYDGGVRVTSSQVRGQGGIRHQAFVFWDDAFINSCRVDQSAATYDPANTDVLKSIRKTSVKTGIWTDPTD